MNSTKDYFIRTFGETINKKVRSAYSSKYLEHQVGDHVLYAYCKQKVTLEEK